MAEVFDKLILQGYGRTSSSSQRFTHSQLSCRSFVQDNLRSILFSKNRERHLREIVICVGGFVGSDQDETLQLSHFTQQQFFEPYDSLVFYVDKFDFLLSCISKGVCTVAEGFEARFKQVILEVIVAGNQVALELMPNPEKEMMKNLKKEKEKMKMRIIERQNLEAEESEQRRNQMMLMLPPSSSLGSSFNGPAQQQRQRSSKSATLSDKEPMKIEEFVPSASSSSADPDEAYQDEDPFLEEQRTRKMLLMASSQRNDNSFQRSSSSSQHQERYDPRRYTTSHNDHMRLLMEIGSSTTVVKNAHLDDENQDDERPARQVSTITRASTNTSKSKRHEQKVEIDENGFVIDRSRKKVLDPVPERHSKIERRKWSFQRFKDMIEEEEKLLKKELMMFRRKDDDFEEGATESAVQHVLLVTEAERVMFEAGEQKATVEKFYHDEDEEERLRKERRNLMTM